MPNDVSNAFMYLILADSKAPTKMLFAYTQLIVLCIVFEMSVGHVEFILSKIDML